MKSNLALYTSYAVTFAFGGFLLWLEIRMASALSKDGWNPHLAGIATVPASVGMVFLLRSFLESYRKERTWGRLICWLFDEHNWESERVVCFSVRPEACSRTAATEKLGVDLRTGKATLLSTCRRCGAQKFHLGETGHTEVMVHIETTDPAKTASPLMN